MKWKSIVLAAAAVVFASSTVKADHVVTTTQQDWNWNMGGDRWTMNMAAEDIFRANEFTLDLSGAYAKNQRKFNDTFDRTMRHGTWGANVGANYFSTAVSVSVQTPCGWMMTVYSSTMHRQV